MIGMELIREYIHSVLLTGRIIDESPLSTFLIALPEHGKTSIVLERSITCAVDVTDTTGKGIQEILKYKADISHIILNDLTALAAHGKNVRAYTIAMINAMTEEGVRSIAFPGQVEVFKNGKRGIIGCVTPALIKDGRNWWNKIGLTSRIFPFGYTYSEDLILRIKGAIDHNAPQQDFGELSIPTIPLTVLVPKKETEEIRYLSDTKAKELGDDTGIRRLKQFRRLAKAHAILRTWKTPVVNQDDIKFVRKIFPYISYETRCIL
jgi:hypothetical protein